MHQSNCAVVKPQMQEHFIHQRLTRSQRKVVTWVESEASGKFWNLLAPQQDFRDVGEKSGEAPHFQEV